MKIGSSFFLYAILFPILENMIIRTGFLHTFRFQQDDLQI